MPENKEIPPKMEYSLTKFGEKFIPTLQTMMAWSETYLCPDYQIPMRNDDRDWFILHITSKFPAFQVISGLPVEITDRRIW